MGTPLLPAASPCRGGLGSGESLGTRRAPSCDKRAFCLRKACARSPHGHLHDALCSAPRTDPAGSVLQSPCHAVTVPKGAGYFLEPVFIIYKHTKTDSSPITCTAETEPAQDCHHCKWSQTPRAPSSLQSKCWRGENYLVKRVIRWLRSSGDVCLNNPAPEAAGVPPVLPVPAPRSRVPFLPALSAQV